MELEEAAKTAELRANNALLRGKVEQAYHIYCAAAESFAAIDVVEVFRRRNNYTLRLALHGLRYGGDGLINAIDILKDDRLPEIREKMTIFGPFFKTALPLRYRIKAPVSAGRTEHNCSARPSHPITAR